MPPSLPCADREAEYGGCKMSCDVGKQQGCNRSPCSCLFPHMVEAPWKLSVHCVCALRGKEAGKDEQKKTLGLHLLLLNLLLRTLLPQCRLWNAPNKKDWRQGLMWTPVKEAEQSPEHVWTRRAPGGTPQPLWTSQEAGSPCWFEYIPDSISQVLHPPKSTTHRGCRISPLMDALRHAGICIKVKVLLLLCIFQSPNNKAHIFIWPNKTNEISSHLLGSMK